MKPGYKTTEFWLSLLAMLLGAFMASGALPVEHWSMKAGGLVATALAAMGYSYSRGVVKAKNGGDQ
jgi:hypothetical protein